MLWRGGLLRWLPWRARCYGSRTRAGHAGAPPKPLARPPAALLVLALASPAPSHGMRELQPSLSSTTATDPQPLARRTSPPLLLASLSASCSRSRSRAWPPAMATTELRPGLSPTLAAMAWGCSCLAVGNVAPVREPGCVLHPRALANPASCVRSPLSTWHCWSLSSTSSHGTVVGAGHCAGLQACTTCCQVYERAGGRGQLLPSSVQVPQLPGACCS